MKKNILNIEDLLEELFNKEEIKILNVVNLENVVLEDKIKILLEDK